MATEITKNGLQVFAKKHKIRITPTRTARYWLRLVTALGCCPCDKNRPACPCDECLAEVKKQGCCKCKFFITPERYEEEKQWMLEKGKKVKDL